MTEGLILNCICISLCVILSISIFQSLPYESFATSPPFIRHVIDNNFDYWNIIEPRRGSIPKSSADISFIPSLESVGYSSSGQFLNATFFLSAPFEQKPLMHLPSYIMWIDSDNNNKTGINRADYAVIIEWNNDTNTWNRIVMEFSHDNAKVLERNDNYTGFFNKDNNAERFDRLFDINKNFINSYLNLEEVNYPDKYNVGFAIYETIKGKEETSMYDTTTWVPIPPPKFDVSLSPPSIELRPNEEKTVKLVLKSNTTLQPRIEFNSGENINIDSVSIIPNSTILPVNGIISTDLDIKSSKNATEGSFTLPITIVISFQYVGNEGDPGLILDSSYYLPLTILPPITLWDIITDSLDTLSVPMQQLAQIASAIGALGVSGALFTLFKKSSKE